MLAQYERANAADALPPLTTEQASHFVQLALGCVQREYPNKPEHVMNDAADVHNPRALHPAFYGCFDWHSCVHGHWLMARALRRFPNLPEAAQIRRVFNENLTAENIQIELAYLGQANRQSFERTYGWAWLLKLADELQTWDDPDARRWAANVQPLADAIANRYLTFLPKQTYPIRTGVHPNTAFGLSFAYDYARRAHRADLQKLIEERSRAYYFADTDYPAKLEPGGEDFLSPCLVEADLMRRILPPEEFAVWLKNYLPRLERGEPSALFTPAVVGDRTDPKLVHLDGLNLSRAWCMRHVADALSPNDPARDRLHKAARAHAEAALAHVASGDYVGEHWLASFAVYLLTE